MPPPVDAQNEASGFYSRICFRRASAPNPSSPQNQPPQDTAQRKPGGWKTMPYILGNETCERLASTGLLSNFMVYLRRVYHMNQVGATSLINVWSMANNFTPLVGAFLSDAYLGRFYTIAIGSIVSILGMVGMTFTAWIPKLHPPECSLPLEETSQCKGATTSQMGFLIMSLCFLSIGSGGIRPCSLPFGVDQFDTTLEEGRKGLGSFYNWYYATFSIILVFTATVVVYIQDSVSWVLGYGIPTLLMFCAIVLFFLGTRVYVYMKPEGSVFTGLARVVVATYKKRKLKLSSRDEIDGKTTTFYDPPLDFGTAVIPKLPLTTQYRFLNKAAIVLENELKPDGTPVNKWSLCSIQQVEELKCVVRVLPIWASTILCLTTIIQQGTFSVSQALKMDRHLGPSFKVPAASLTVTSYLTLAIWIPLYDRVIVPQLRKITHHPNGITQLQRIGIGSIFSVVAMVVAGIVEKERREMAQRHRLMSVFWLAPQHILMGLCEAFSIIGQMEFLNNEFPEHLRTMANALLSISFTIATYVSTLVVIIVHKTSGGHGKPDWLTNDLNAGRVDYYYYIVAAMAFANIFVFVYCARRYQYKGAGERQTVKPCEDQVELTSEKKLDV